MERKWLHISITETPLIGPRKSGKKKETHGRKQRAVEAAKEGTGLASGLRTSKQDLGPHRRGGGEGHRLRAGCNAVDAGPGLHPLHPGHSVVPCGQPRREGSSPTVGGHSWEGEQEQWWQGPEEERLETLGS